MTDTRATQSVTDGASVQPLRHIRVLDLTRVLAGPYCTMVLGDLGAEIVKVEAPGQGDSVRGIAPYYPGGESHYFMALNRNKRSVVIDLKSSDGRQALLDLVAHCDVVVENFRSGVMDRLGLGFDVLREHNPSVILCSISGYGSDGPWSHKSAFDLIAQARSGVMHITGDPEGPPTKLGLPMGDLGAGLWSAVAILAALEGRRAGDGAQHIDVSMLDGLLGMLGYLGQLTLLTGESPNRVGNAHHNVVPYGCYASKDGYLALALLVDQFWTRFCHAAERVDLLDDQRFATPDARRDHRDVVDELVTSILSARTTAEWMKRFEEHDVPASPILDVQEALEQEAVSHRGLVRTLQHPDAGEVEYVGSPIRIGDHAGEKPVLAPPRVGEHTREVLREVAGFDDDRIDELVSQGVLCERRVETASFEAPSAGDDSRSSNE